MYFKFMKKKAPLQISVWKHLTAAVTDNGILQHMKDSYNQD